MLIPICNSTVENPLLVDFSDATCWLLTRPRQPNNPIAAQFLVSLAHLSINLMMLLSCIVMFSCGCHSTGCWEVDEVDWVDGGLMGLMATHIPVAFQSYS